MSDLTREEGFLTDPAAIERRSMEIIDRELAARGITPDPENAEVLRRVIHTTADFDYAGALYFSPGAVPRGVAALRAGAGIVTDTSMARAGINQTALGALGGALRCYMGDPAVAAAARTAGTTRADVSMRTAAAELPGAVFAVGNAPTALLALDELIAAGLRPALVIAVPVGFVNVTEAKERLIDCCAACDVPIIAARGRKGGSTVAAAVCNALLYAAAGLRDPARRAGPAAPEAHTPDPGRGLVHICCGEGKGKTTAAAGLALRAAGAGKRVVFVQLLKDGTSSEIGPLRAVPGITVLHAPRVLGWFRSLSDPDRARAREDCAALLARAFAEPAELLVLDEAIAACELGALDEASLLRRIDTRPAGLELVLTGRHPSPALLSRGDYITEMRALRHPYTAGVTARKGIEF